MEEEDLLCDGDCIGCETEFYHDLFYCARCSCRKTERYLGTIIPLNFIMYRPHMKYKTRTKIQFCL